MKTDYRAALLLLWDLYGGECEHGRGFAEQCPCSCVFNDARPALRAAYAEQVRSHGGSEMFDPRTERT